MFHIPHEALAAGLFAAGGNKIKKPLTYAAKAPSQKTHGVPPYFLFVARV